MNALVTGGGGFLGRRIVEMLVGRGEKVRALGRHRYPEVEKLGVECLVGDIRDAQAVVEACAGAEVVFHCAALAGFWGRRRDFLGINLRGTANVIQACLAHRVQRLVYTSSPSVAIGSDDIEGADETLPYPRRYLAHYPESKARAEQMVLDANGWEMAPADESVEGDAPSGEEAIIRLRTCALRPHLIWGPRDPHLIPRVVQAARAGKLRRVGDGTNRADITYVDNAAHAHLLAADDLAGEGRAAGKAYFIGDAEPVVLWQWIDELLARLDITPVSRGVPYRFGWCLGATLELVHTLVPALGEPRMTRFVAAQLAKSHFFSHENACIDFGYEPIVDRETGMELLIRWLREERQGTD